MSGWTACLKCSYDMDGQCRKCGRPKGSPKNWRPAEGQGTGPVTAATAISSEASLQARLDEAQLLGEMAEASQKARIRIVEDGPNGSKTITPEQVESDPAFQVARLSAQEKADLRRLELAGAPVEWPQALPIESSRPVTMQQMEDQLADLQIPAPEVAAPPTFRCCKTLGITYDPCSRFGCIVRSNGHKPGWKPPWGDMQPIA